jgi:Lipase (class 3)
LTWSVYLYLLIREPTLTVLCVREKKLLKVVFRGSVTVGDWMADIDSRMATIPNPIKDVGNGPDVGKEVPISPTVSIHKGFYSYMFAARSKNAKTCSKYETIVGHIKRLLVGRAGYKLRVSGHSLGGSLSIVFAFHAAADPHLPKPVTCVSFGSPRCGNLDFARSYQHLEQLGWLRSIRVVNDKDFVTMVPDRLAYAVALTNSIYRHVGIELKLYQVAASSAHSKKHPRIHFPTCHATIAQHLADDASQAAWNWFTRPVNLVQSWRHDYAVNHSLKEYADRLAGAAEYLQSRTVDGLVNEYRAHCHD